MSTLNPYLNFNGNCEEAFNFYKEGFKKDFSYLARFKEMPEDMCKQVPESDLEKIMHVSLPISNETVLMGSDSSEAFGKVNSMGDNISLCINAESREEADRLFNFLSDGGKVLMGMSETFWKAYYGMFIDKFGIQWMVMSPL